MDITNLPTGESKLFGKYIKDSKVWEFLSEYLKDKDEQWVKVLLEDCYKMISTDYEGLEQLNDQTTKFIHDFEEVFELFGDYNFDVTQSILEELLDTL